jgi:hypothetical protein
MKKEPTIRDLINKLNAEKFLKYKSEAERSLLFITLWNNYPDIVVEESTKTLIQNIFKGTK